MDESDLELMKVHIGEAGRATLKSLISAKCRHDPEIKAKLVEQGRWGAGEMMVALQGIGHRAGQVRPSV